MDWTLYPNFRQAEFLCSCCGREAMQADFLGRLQRIRSAYGRPMLITSGYRCPQHNARVSPTGRDGPHTTGRAVDILVRHGDALDLVVIGRREGMRGFGAHQKGGARFLHLDDLPWRPADGHFWTY